jgi:hypothetical protein
VSVAGFDRAKGPVAAEVASRLVRPPNEPSSKEEAMFVLKTDYNDSCNCHPETMTVELESETMLGLGEKLAEAELDHPRARFDVSETVRVEQVEDDVKAVIRKTADDRKPVLEAERKVEAQKIATQKRKAVLLEKMRGLERDLERDLHDLSAAGIAKRQAAIEQVAREYNT